ncbi:MAG: PHP domain-containing protein [Ruminococcaceae bacterium]|nr:PHP domain-containing protein [Oscillospiraceae bacterium]
MEALLNDKNVEVRLNALRKLVETVPAPEGGGHVNNHIHTTYSFSPYSPTKAIWMARQSGLRTAGIMDHDSVGGCREFIEAGKIAGLATTIGVECRCSFANTPVGGRRINNPDQDSIAYVTIHAIPHKHIDRVAAFFAPYTEKRNERNRKMIEKINALTPVTLDFEKDVVPLSNFHEGGSITERHILFALALKLLAYSDDICTLLESMGVALSEKVRGYLCDAENPHKAYDLLGVLKSSLIEKIYIDATDECPDVRDIIALGKEIDAIVAYAYLGDVGDSVTGDKKTQKFEDDYLPELFETLHDLGFCAVTYMPSRNTMDQLLRLKDFCKQYGLMEVSGEDINSPRQSFVCEALQNPVFANLIDSTWELIRHENERGEE